jgi:hypothetical protein
MDEQCVPGVVATQVAYHMRVGAGFAAAGDSMRAASEIALSWTILSTHGWVDSLMVAHDLPSPTATNVFDWEAVERRTVALALELQSHIVSEGQYATATIYETAATTVHDIIAGWSR